MALTIQGRLPGSHNVAIRQTVENMYLSKCVLLESLGIKGWFDVHDIRNGTCLCVIWEQNDLFVNFSVDTSNKITLIEDEINKINV